jgi:hypothetical protein
MSDGIIISGPANGCMALRDAGVTPRLNITGDIIGRYLGGFYARRYRPLGHYVYDKVESLEGSITGEIIDWPLGFG